MNRSNDRSIAAATFDATTEKPNGVLHSDRIQHVTDIYI